MALRKRKSEDQEELWVPTHQMAKAPGHVFYERLNGLLGDAGFDAFVEDLVAPCYAAKGRPGIAPGVYFRMLFVGYFEGIDSQRGIAWRCEDSLSLRKFLGLKLTESVPDHSSLTRIRDRYPVEVVDQVFAFVLQMANERKLISGSAIGVDATMLEANAAMKSIVRRDTDEDWKAYIRRLMQEEGVIDEGDEPTDEELRRYDRQRKGKKVSNKEWKSSSDDDARIVKMKTGHTRMGYKAEHAVDLQSEVVLSATVRHGTDRTVRLWWKRLLIHRSTLRMPVPMRTCGRSLRTRVITAMLSWRNAICWGCEPMFRSHRLHGGDGGPTNHRKQSWPCSTIAVVHGGSKANVISGSAVNESNGVLLISVRRAARDGHGCEASRRSTSVTVWWSPPIIWVGSCGHCSEPANRGSFLPFVVCSCLSGCS